MPNQTRAGDPGPGRASQPTNGWSDLAGGKFPTWQSSSRDKGPYRHIQLRVAWIVMILAPRDTASAAPTVGLTWLIG